MPNETKVFDEYSEPLIPKSPVGISLVAVVVTISLAMLGFIGQRALDLDERVIALQEQQKNDESMNSLITEITTRLTVVEERIERRSETIKLVQKLEERIEDRGAAINLVQEIDERLNRVEVRVEDMLRELEKLERLKNGQ
jgi:DNA repair exonuclease SbcCD ATPase subunit